MLAMSFVDRLSPLTILSPRAKKLVYLEIFSCVATQISALFKLLVLLDLLLAGLLSQRTLHARPFPLLLLRQLAINIAIFYYALTFTRSTKYCRIMVGAKPDQILSIFERI